MSLERQCKVCGGLEPIRLNFGDNIEAEREFHSREYICSFCKKDIYDRESKK